jgi:hypothetical protein
VCTGPHDCAFSAVRNPGRALGRALLTSHSLTIRGNIQGICLSYKRRINATTPEVAAGSAPDYTPSGGQTETTLTRETLYRGLHRNPAEVSWRNAEMLGPHLAAEWRPLPAQLPFGSQAKIGLVILLMPWLPSPTPFQIHYSCTDLPFGRAGMAQSVWRLGYRQDDRGVGVRFPAGAKYFYLLHNVQTGSGAHSASYPMGTRGCFLSGKAAGAWSWPLTAI